MIQPAVTLRAASAVQRADATPTGTYTADLLDSFATRYDDIRSATPSSRAATAVFLESVTGAAHALALATVVLVPIPPTPVDE